MAEKKVIKKSDWSATFNLIGTPKISDDYTFKIDEKSEKSKWVYNSMNLGIDCGEKHGVVYAELMGGYSEENENKIYAHGKKEDGSDDFEKQSVVDWEDRDNEDVLEEIGELSFLTVGLEKTSEGKTFYKKFLSAYDAIAYIKEHLSEDMVVNVKYLISKLSSSYSTLIFSALAGISSKPNSAHSIKVNLPVLEYSLNSETTDFNPFSSNLYKSAIDCINPASTKATTFFSPNPSIFKAGFEA